MSMHIAIVGDVHNEWDPIKDSKALHTLNPDIVLFVGDFGDTENVDLVQNISKLDLPKAVILGNHDCCKTISPFAKYLFEETPKDEVQEQLDLLGDVHVGFSRLDFPTKKLSIVGGRPFSRGGEKINASFSKLLAPLYNINNFHESAERIVANAKEAPQENFLVILAHNGPRGLGSNAEDICGCDWNERGGDQGDPDLEEAIATIKQQGIQVPLVVFGHMHRCPPKRRSMLVDCDRTIYLNTALVPRVKNLKRYFVLVDVEDGKIESIYEAWITVEEDNCEVEKTLIYSHLCNITETKVEENL